MPIEFALLLLLMTVAGLWLDNMRQRDRALHVARHLCRTHEVQLLDHTVGLAALRLRRHDGRLALERHYAFEVSVQGSDRQPGTLWLVQGQLAGVRARWLQPPERDPRDTHAAVTNLVDRLPRDRGFGARDS